MLLRRLEAVGSCSASATGGRSAASVSSGISGLISFGGLGWNLVAGPPALNGAALDRRLHS